MDNFSPAQYDRFEAYRRHALPKQAVRRVRLPRHTCPLPKITSPSAFKVIQQTTGQQVSQPVAQIVAGFAKVFVGEMVEKGKHFWYPCIRHFQRVCFCNSTSCASSPRGDWSAIP